MGVMSEEPEDFNAFGKWDAVGATALLGVVPAVLHFTLCQKDIPGTIPWLIGMVIAVVTVYLLSFVISDKTLGRFVNLAAAIITPIYVVMGVLMMHDAIVRDFHLDEKEAPTTQQPK